MLIPTIVADDFFRDPDEIVKLSKTLEFNKAPDGRWPGYRSKLLHQIDRVLFDKINKKILSVIFPGQHELQYRCASSFQLIKQDPKEQLREGWVHYDTPHLFTAIIYLSKHEDVGTTIVDPKKFTSQVINVDKKNDFHLGKKVKNINLRVQENNRQFKDSIVVQSKYNRILIFDSSQYHYVPNYISKDTTEDRLTIVCFFDNVAHDHGIRFPIPEMRKHKED
tara:strand:- start:54 stop:719 length:666 start_codon:yes stop_codon:yes gene_type:complete